MEYHKKIKILTIAYFLCSFVLYIVAAYYLYTAYVRYNVSDQRDGCFDMDNNNNKTIQATIMANFIITGLIITITCLTRICHGLLLCTVADMVTGFIALIYVNQISHKCYGEIKTDEHYYYIYKACFTHSFHFYEIMSYITIAIIMACCNNCTESLPTHAQTVVFSNRQNNQLNNQLNDQQSIPPNYYDIYPNGLSPPPYARQESYATSV